ncbi:uncharacterized protein LOC135961229 [Calliphora vicina]|uniref:uncharacterized protein LOC135961229 n=1 Tax=Calliphora vicina TaxID=7373 RepID=UPI00325A637C
MKELKIDILGVSETWWKESGEFKSENTKVYHSGNENTHRRGVAIIVKSHIANCVAEYVPMSDRTMLIKIIGKPTNLNIIQVYAPTCDGSAEEIEKFYDDIEKLLKMTKPHEITIVLGDFNAKVGHEEVRGVAGKYGLGERNERGDRLVQFCQEHKMTITNTLFRLHPRRLYTWKSPQDNRENVVRNQIDYILINRRYCTCVTKCSTFPGADVPSDHNLLLANVRTKLAIVRKHKRQHKIDIRKLNDPLIRNEIKERINDELGEINGEDVENLWDNVKNIVSTTTKDTLGNCMNTRQEKWMTDEIRELRIERSRHKNVNYEIYWELNKEIRTATRAAKNALLNRQCQEIEVLQNLHDDFNLHKKLKEAAGVYKRSSASILYDDNNEAVFEMDKKDKKRIWKDYVSKLFTDEERSAYECSTDIPMTGSPITRLEVECAITTLKDRKASGPDEIPSEVLKLIDGDNTQLFVTLFNYIYDTGLFPQEWLKSTLLPYRRRTMLESVMNIG